jgi:hypothetical protein
MFRYLFQQYLDYSFVDKSQNVFVRVLERPGEWLPQSELDQLVSDLRTIVKASIPKENLNYGVLTGEKAAMSRAVITIIYDQVTKQPLAFNALAYMPCILRQKPVDVLHLGLVIVSPGRREGGFSWILYGLTSIMLFLRSRFRPIWITNVTQVPAIIGKVSESFSDVYPSPILDSKPSIDHIMLARQIMEKYRHVFGVGADASFDEKKFVIANAYTGGSDHLKKKFTEAQPHRREVYNEFCMKHLNYDRGDDFLQLGRLDINVTKDYLTKSVPKAAVLSLAIGLTMLALQGLFLPLLHWFQVKQHQGEIRPWN